MAQQISALTPIDPFPSRVLPQDRFDQAVRTNMSQLSDMISQLNSNFIPQANTLATQTETNASTASTKASEAASSASTASTKASEASASATTATQKATAASTSESNALSYAQRAESAAGVAVDYYNNGVLLPAHGGTGRSDGYSQDVYISGSGGNVVTAKSTGQIGNAVAVDGSSVNCNTLKTGGVYFVSGATLANNYPTTGSFFLEVKRYADNGNQIQQHIWANISGGIWKRLYAGNNTWYAWQGVVVTIDSGDDGAAFHNGIYRGRNLTNVYTLAQLSTKLSNGDFSDLYIGDYITLPVVIDGTSKNFNFRIAHFNYWKYMGYTSFTQNHIVFVPDTPFKNMQMQTTNTTEGGVSATLVWAALQGDLYTAVNASTCMNGHVKTHNDWISGLVDTSALSAAGANFQGSTVLAEPMWRDVKLGLMREPMVYGGTAFSSSGYDVGCGKSQLALFRLDPTWINSRSSRSEWWLGCVTSSLYFAAVSYGGGSVASARGAAISLGVRPYLLFA